MDRQARTTASRVSMLDKTARLICDTTSHGSVIHSAHRVTVHVLQRNRQVCQSSLQGLVCASTQKK